MSFWNNTKEGEKMYLIILGFELEVGLRVGADGADLGGLPAHTDVAAVGALPDHVTVTGEYKTALQIGQ